LLSALNFDIAALLRVYAAVLPPSLCSRTLKNERLMIELILSLMNLSNKIKPKFTISAALNSRRKFKFS
jgi:hypothetical protein